MPEISAVLPKSQATAYTDGQFIRPTVSTALRSGPGNNLPLVAAIPAGQQGSVAPHAMNGLAASGDNWWRWTTGGATGWSAQGSLEAVPPSAVDNWMLY